MNKMTLKSSFKNLITSITKSVLVASLIISLCTAQSLHAMSMGSQPPSAWSSFTAFKNSLSYVPFQDHAKTALKTIQPYWSVSKPWLQTGLQVAGFSLAAYGFYSLVQRYRYPDSGFQRRPDSDTRGSTSPRIKPNQITTVANLTTTQFVHEPQNGENSSPVPTPLPTPASLSGPIEIIITPAADQPDPSSCSYCAAANACALGARLLKADPNYNPYHDDELMTGRLYHKFYALTQPNIIEQRKKIALIEHIQTHFIKDITKNAPEEFKNLLTSTAQQEAHTLAAECLQCCKTPTSMYKIGTPTLTTIAQIAYAKSLTSLNRSDILNPQNSHDLPNVLKNYITTSEELSITHENINTIYAEKYLELDGKESLFQDQISSIIDGLTDPRFKTNLAHFRRNYKKNLEQKHKTEIANENDNIEKTYQTQTTELCSLWNTIASENNTTNLTFLPANVALFSALTDDSGDLSLAYGHWLNEDETAGLLDKYSVMQTSTPADDLSSSVLKQLTMRATVLGALENLGTEREEIVTREIINDCKLSWNDTSTPNYLRIFLLLKIEPGSKRGHWYTVAFFKLNGQKKIYIADSARAKPVAITEILNKQFITSCKITIKDAQGKILLDYYTPTQKLLDALEEPSQAV